MKLRNFEFFALNMNFIYLLLQNYRISFFVDLGSFALFMKECFEAFLGLKGDFTSLRLLFLVIGSL